MIENRDTKQSSFLGNYVYNAVVPKDHILRKIDEAIDFSFVDKLAGAVCFAQEEAAKPGNMTGMEKAKAAANAAAKVKAKVKVMD